MMEEKAQGHSLQELINPSIGDDIEESEKKSSVQVSEIGDSSYCSKRIRNNISKDKHRQCEEESAAIMNLRSTFQIYNQICKSGSFFNIIASLYSNRKAIIFFGFHIVCTAMIFFHFALIKYRRQDSQWDITGGPNREYVPLAANKREWKVYTPTFEFGLMHAILFQMAVIPLTMSRMTIARLSRTFVNKYVPMELMFRFHILTGYLFCGFILLATFAFFLFFGQMCRDGEQQFCNKFKSEIFLTGLSIAIMLVVVLITSYLRYRIKYEIFYWVHHLVFAMFVLSAVHTFDKNQRGGFEKSPKDFPRSQSIVWFTATLMFYIVDRVAQNINNRYAVKVRKVQTVTQEKSGKCSILLSIDRPRTFTFAPGQHALLKVNKIDSVNWHPFSIGSNPSSSTLDFVIEVHGPGSWSEKLFTLLTEEIGLMKQSECVEVMGPHGAALGDTSDFTHAVVIGGNTGVVPVLSMLRQHISKLKKAEPNHFFKYICGKQGDDSRNYLKYSMELNSKHSSIARFSQIASTRLNINQGAVTPQVFSRILFGKEAGNLRYSKIQSGELQYYMDLISLEAEKVKRYFIFRVATIILPVIGCVVLCMGLSWNTVSETGISHGVPITLFPWMDSLFASLTIIFQCCFCLEALVSIVFFISMDFMNYIDVAASVIGLLLSGYWTYEGYWTSMDLRMFSFFILVTTYMILRSWTKKIQDECDGYDSISDNDDMYASLLRSLHFVWVTRSASLAATMVPIIADEWDSLVDVWGLEGAKKICRISIYVTDKDQSALDDLIRVLETTNSSINMNNQMIKLDRPHLTMDVVERNMVDRLGEDMFHGKVITGDRKIPTKTLFAFCGSPKLRFKMSKAFFNTHTAIISTMNGHHRMSLECQTYSSPKDQTVMEKKKQRTAVSI